MGSLLHNFLIGGVNHSIPGNGGIDCVNYLPMWQKVLETVILVPLSIYGIVWSIGSLEFPKENQVKSGEIKCEALRKANGTSHDRSEHQQSNGSTKNEEQQQDNEMEVFVEAPVKPLRDYLFRIYLAVFIVELIYKMISKTGIFLLNPCHVTTVLQLILLRVKENSPWSTQFFRFHMYTMPGAILALLFPILNTRLLPGEVVIYYIQHFFIVFIPLFLMLHGEAFVPESINNIVWPVFSFCIILLYHYLLLQPLGLLTYVNLNCILCPAVSDPFASRLWRIAGIFHQGLLTPAVTKLYSLFGLWLVADTKHAIESSMHVAKKTI